MSSIFDFCPIWGCWEIDRNSRPLGKGSFGTVWKAYRRDDVTGDLYYSAIKHISIPQDEKEIRSLIEESVLSDTQSAKKYYSKILESLVSEIKTMYSLRGHTNIVSYEDHLIMPKKDEVGYDLFIRMELLTSLSAKLEQGGFKRADVIKLGMDISKAIAVLNAFNYVHRDIKPQNIFVSGMGEYKLGDYGTARLLENSTISMTKKGTYAYMAPEVYKGEQANRTVDIYSLGIVMYRLMNGNRLPFLSPVADIISSAESEKALLRRIRGDSLPKPAYADDRLAKVILTACAYRSEDRYQTGQEMYEALKALDDAPTVGDEETQTIDVVTSEVDVGIEIQRHTKQKEDNPPVRKKEPDSSKIEKKEDKALEIKKGERYETEEKDKAYARAEILLATGKYIEAAEAFGELGKFKNSESRMQEALLKHRKRIIHRVVAISVCTVVILAAVLCVFVWSHGGGNNNTDVPALINTDSSLMPTEEPTPEPTEEPTPEPTDKPTPEPTEEPTPEPTEEPTAEPTEKPTPEPTEKPTPKPTEKPTPEPTEEPTPEPTEEPTAEPTEKPTPEPTEKPTPEPTEEPTPEPTEEPTPEPTPQPTPEPTEEPTPQPIKEPTQEPTKKATAISISNPKAAVDWKDPALAKAMKTQSGIKNRAITYEDVATISMLNLSNCDINDISALEYLPNLKTLWLSGNKITDISVLANLTELNTLWLDRNGITDVSALSELHNLHTLWLNDNSISDISALSNLKGLRFLLLDHNAIRDISALSNLTNIINLSLSNNDIYDIEVLNRLINLEDLNLSNNRISDISSVATLENLKTLRLDNNAISDIDSLEALTGLEVLSVRNNSISDISSLRNLVNLIKLDITGNVIVDYSVIDGLKKTNVAK